MHCSLALFTLSAGFRATPPLPPVSLCPPIPVRHGGEGCTGSRRRRCRRRAHGPFRCSSTPHLTYLWPRRGRCRCRNGHGCDRQKVAPQRRRGGELRRPRGAPAPAGSPRILRLDGVGKGGSRQRKLRRFAFPRSPTAGRAIALRSGPCRPGDFAGSRAGSGGEDRRGEDGIRLQ